MKAVILAGGRGERIRPISDTLPKALVPIEGKPILAHQIEQLERIGIHTYGISSRKHFKLLQKIEYFYETSLY